MGCENFKLACRILRSVCSHRIHRLCFNDLAIVSIARSLITILLTDSLQRTSLNWQMAHSLWQARWPGTSYRPISGTLHQELCFYRISKLTCTIDILTVLWIFKFFRLVVYRNCICIVVVGLFLRPCATDERRLSK